MASIKINWMTGFTGLFSDNDRTVVHDGVLTTDHAASSYGIPVVVGDNGVVYGPADLPSDGVTDTQCPITDEAHDLIHAARRGGYRVNSMVHPE